MLKEKIERILKGMPTVTECSEVKCSENDESHDESSAITELMNVQKDLIVQVAVELRRNQSMCEADDLAKFLEENVKKIEHDIMKLERVY